MGAEGGRRRRPGRRRRARDRVLQHHDRPRQDQPDASLLHLLRRTRRGLRRAPPPGLAGGRRVRRLRDRRPRPRWLERPGLRQDDGRARIPPAVPTGSARTATTTCHASCRASRSPTSTGTATWTSWRSATSYDDKPETFANSSRIFWGSAEGFSPERYDIFPTFCGATGYLADLTGNGYLDVLVGDKRGYVLIYLGGPDGYSLERTQRIPMWKDWKGGRQHGGRPQRQRLAGPGGVELRPLSPQARHPDDLLRRPRRLRLAQRPGLQGRVLARADVGRRPQQQRPAGPDRPRLLDRPDAGRAHPDFLEPRGPLRPGAPAGAARRRGIRGAADRSRPQRLDRPVRGVPPQRRRGTSSTRRSSGTARTDSRTIAPRRCPAWGRTG